MTDCPGVLLRFVPRCAAVLAAMLNPEDAS